MENTLDKILEICPQFERIFSDGLCEEELKELYECAKEDLYKVEGSTS